MIEVITTNSVLVTGSTPTTKSPNTIRQAAPSHRGELQSDLEVA